MPCLAAVAEGGLGGGVQDSWAPSTTPQNTAAHSAMRQLMPWAASRSPAQSIPCPGGPREPVRAKRSAPVGRSQSP
eukprot:4226222-Alexandrium_andersonii.AAC.1